MILQDATPTFVRTCAIAAIAAFTCGYDLNWWGAILAHPWFNTFFGDHHVLVDGQGSIISLSATQQAVGSAASSIGNILGAIIAIIIVRPFGYRVAIICSVMIVVIGSIIQLTAAVGEARYWQLVGGKVIVTVAVGMNNLNIPIYLAGCAPPQLRATAINSFATFVAIGAIVAAGVIYGLSTHIGRIVVWVPCGLQMLTPVLSIITIALLPESPQWLISKGRVAEATGILRKLRRDVNSVDLEVEQILSNQSEAASNTASLSRCFQGVNLRRSLACIGVQCFFQAQGLSFLLSYMATLFVQLGLPNPFKIYVIIYSLVLACTVASFFYQDTIGRRSALLAGALGCAALMIGFAAVIAAISAPTGAAANGCVALVVLWFVAFTSTWYPVWTTVTAELPAVELREYTLGIAIVANSLVGALVVFVSPYLQKPEYANLGGKIGFLYGSVSIAAFIFVFFMVPELKGRTLPEIDWMFNYGVPIRQMGTFAIPSDIPLQNPMNVEGGVFPSQSKDMIEVTKHEIEMVEEAQGEPQSLLK